jgi:hypothetical protein
MRDKMNLIRKLIAPIALRFKDTDSLIEAMHLLERGKLVPKQKGGVPLTTIDDAMLIIARELIRRKVVFWC